MEQGKRRTRGARRRKRPSPLDIISGIEAPADECSGSELPSRRSPSCVVADADPTEQRKRDAPHEIGWPAKRKSNRSKPSGTGPTHIPLGTLPEHQSFWAIWAEHQEYLRRYSLHWMSNNADDADDALSNAMLLALRKFPKYAHAITNTRYWLMRLVHNVCMDHHRAASRLQCVESDLRWDELEKRAVSPGSQMVRRPDQEAISEELLLSLQRGLQKLPASLREPLTLRCLYGLAYSDIAASMSLTECTVRKRVQLARSKLGLWIGVC